MDAVGAMRENPRATVTVDRDGIIHQWADEVTEVVGYSADQTLGRNLDVVIPPVLRRLHWHGFDRAMRRGRLSHPGMTYKIPTLRSDGRIVVAHATFKLIPARAELSTAPSSRSLVSWPLGKAWRGAQPSHRSISYVESGTGSAPTVSWVWLSPR
jgi:PAS domain S-box-containing protein